MPTQPPDDDEEPQPQVTIGHVANKELLREIGNLRMSVRHHYRALTTLYYELRDMQQPAPKLFPHKLLEIERQQHAETSVRLAALATVVDS